MWKKNKMRAFFAFLCLSAYFFMLTPFYTLDAFPAETIRKTVSTTFSKEDCMNLLKKIEKSFRLL